MKKVLSVNCFGTMLKQFVLIEDKKVTISTFEEIEGKLSLIDRLREEFVVSFSEAVKNAREIGKKWGSYGKIEVKSSTGNTDNDVAELQFSNFAYNICRTFVKVSDLNPELKAQVLNDTQKYIWNF